MVCGDQRERDSPPTAFHPPLDGGTVQMSIIAPVSYTHLDVYKRQLHLTAYDAELYPVELEAALDTLDAALSNGSFTEAEQGWAKLLCLYLTTPIDQRSELPRSPAEVSA